MRTRRGARTTTAGASSDKAQFKAIVKPVKAEVEFPPQVGSRAQCIKGTHLLVEMRRSRRDDGKTTEVPAESRAAPT